MAVVTQRYSAHKRFANNKGRIALKLSYLANIAITNKGLNSVCNHWISMLIGKVYMCDGKYRFK